MDIELLSDTIEYRLILSMGRYHYTRPGPIKDRKRAIEIKWSKGVAEAMENLKEDEGEIKGTDQIVSSYGVVPAFKTDKQEDVGQCGEY